MKSPFPQKFDLVVKTFLSIRFSKRFPQAQILYLYLYLAVMRSCVFLQDKLVDLVPTIIGKLADKLMIVCKVCHSSIEQGTGEETLLFFLGDLIFISY